MKKAKADRNDEESRLYGTYPSIHSSRAVDGGRNYEQLDVHIAMSFSQDVVSSGVFSKDYNEDGGLFMYTKEEAEWIRRLLDFSGKAVQAKFMTMVVYLFELGYDLAIGCTDNISLSPGFEQGGLRGKKN